MKSKLSILAVALLLSSSTFAQKGKWVTLFDGKTFTNWHVYNKAGQPISDKWKVQDGTLVFAGKAKGEKHGDDLITDKEYENFELQLEWKVSEGANSGIFYGVNEDPKYGVPYLTGPEIQVLDNERHPDAKAGKNGNHKAGALYDMIPSASVTKPAGEWNTVRIIKNKGEVSVYQNGTLSVKYKSEGPEWEALVANSKFKGWEGFGKFSKGHIGLQDHGDAVSFRKIRIKEL
ncbi:protein of unknown function DUF1080 [Emticicia oligotrophica DSM 17448]|uniref:3-keto-alpha-glucoside-1,2-lyase/3-keto-2-hydroxy-glucal hydratase domain-containing protein n=1 Tax=Emticicia oligotrophica (strain DSM 17448 / CIP 109782 / MTCC 6937 / GPTSA100-15) TaxID=929562 RepID=A0ABM5MXH5_EMTOG|nr:DUF1080 domain-containing protein [Emticicia oligotrophica]AFK01734.1 protein of unknown function DUF1080 [Emticicia oligotrophica DSM 17448]